MKTEVYPYHYYFTEVVNRFNANKIDRNQALKEIEVIEDNACEFYPDAEPDGDITFAAANAVHNLTTRI